MYWYWQLQSIIAQAAARSFFQSSLSEESTSLEPDLSIFCSSSAYSSTCGETVSSPTPSQASRCGSPLLALYCKKINPFYNLNCSARERAPSRRVTEIANFSTLNVGLAGTGNRTQATCLAGSVTRRSAIHYLYDHLCNPCSTMLKRGRMPKICLDLYL
jgi:hypothetical protein